MGSLTGKTAIITGGGSGIGAATAQAFVAAGATIAIVGRTPEKLKATAAACKPAGRCHAFACDAADPAQVKRTADDAIAALGGRLDILVNNAGLNLKQRAARDLTPELWRQVLQANLDSAFFFIQAALPVMAKQRDGLIVNVTSVAGKRAGKLGGSAYSASKFGMQALSLCVGQEEKEHGIRCTAIIPGEVDTPILDQRPIAVTSEQRQKILKPEDVAAAILFVASQPVRVNIPELVIVPSSQAWA